VKSAFAARLEDPRVEQSFQMVTQRRGRQIHVLLNRARRGALGTGWDDETQDGEAYRISECAELFRMML
jgi:hypothetical protein